MSDEIMRWIENSQKGKSGIYPFLLSLDVCAVFNIPLIDAQNHVLKHIDNELNNSNKQAAVTQSAE